MAPCELFTKSEMMINDLTSNTDPKNAISHENPSTMGTFTYGRKSLAVR